MIQSMMEGLRKEKRVSKFSILARAGTVHKLFWDSFTKNLQTRQTKQYPIHMLFDTVMSTAKVSKGAGAAGQISEVQRLYNTKVTADKEHVKVIYIIAPSPNSKGRVLGDLAVVEKQKEVLFLPG